MQKKKVINILVFVSFRLSFYITLLFDLLRTLSSSFLMRNTCLSHTVTWLISASHLSYVFSFPPVLPPDLLFSLQLTGEAVRLIKSVLRRRPRMGKGEEGREIMWREEEAVAKSIPQVNLRREIL